MRMYFGCLYRAAWICCFQSCKYTQKLELNVLQKGSTVASVCSSSTRVGKCKGIACFRPAAQLKKADRIWNVHSSANISFIYSRILLIWTHIIWVSILFKLMLRPDQHQVYWKGSLICTPHNSTKYSGPVCVRLIDSLLLFINMQSQ